MFILNTFQIKAQNFYQWGMGTKKGDPRDLDQCYPVAPSAVMEMSCIHIVHCDSH